MRGAVESCRGGLVLLTLAGHVLAVQADTAILPSGKRLEGELVLKGGLRFAPAGAGPALPLEQVDQVRLAGAAATPFVGSVVHQVLLPNDQRLTGEMFGLNRDTLSLRTAWAPRLTVPRVAVRAVLQPPGVVTVFADGFEAGLDAWTCTGKPRLDAGKQTSGKHGLLLDGAGQSCSLQPAEPVQAGRVSIYFYDPGSQAGARWLVECSFQEKDRLAAVRVVIGGEQEYRILEPGLGRQGLPRPRSVGWHRLEIEWGDGLMLASVDDVLLSAGRVPGPAGPLRQVRLACVGLPGAAEVRGQVWLDDFALARVVPVLRHQPADPAQDEVWLLSGDQLLGEVQGAGRAGIDFRGRLGKRLLPWAGVRGLYLKQQIEPCRTTEGEHVRLWLRPARGTEPDELEAQVQALDARQITVRHPELGELRLDRGQVLRLRWLFSGKWIELDNGAHHLGPAGELLSPEHPLRAESTSWKRSFRLDAVPERAYLGLEVFHLKGRKDGAGEPRTVLLLNGQPLGDLNDQVPQISEVPRHLRIPLPVASLRVGENTLEIRQAAELKTGQYASCGVARLVLELPAAARVTP